MRLFCPPVPSSEIRSRISALENQLSEKVGTLKSIQNEMVQTKKELAAKEGSLQKARDELSLAHTRMTQDSERVKKTKKNTTVQLQKAGAGGAMTANSAVSDTLRVLVIYHNISLPWNIIRNILEEKM